MEIKNPLGNILGDVSLFHCSFLWPLPHEWMLMLQVKAWGASEEGLKPGLGWEKAEEGGTSFLLFSTATYWSNSRSI